MIHEGDDIVFHQRCSVNRRFVGFVALTMTAAIKRNHAMIAREQTEPSGNAPELFSRGEAVNQHHGASAAAIFIMNFQAIGIEKWHCIHLLALRIYRGSTQGHNPPRLLSLLVVSFFFRLTPCASGHVLRSRGVASTARSLVTPVCRTCRTQQPPLGGKHRPGRIDQGLCVFLPSVKKMT